MRIITKSIYCGGERFALVCEPSWGELKYGTIPYDELDEAGRLMRRLNGFQMCVARSISEAIDKREIRCELAHWMAAHPDADEQERLEAIISIGGNIKNE